MTAKTVSKQFLLDNAKTAIRNLERQAMRDRVKAEWLLAESRQAAEAWRRTTGAEIEEHLNTLHIAKWLLLERTHRDLDQHHLAVWLVLEGQIKAERLARSLRVAVEAVSA